MRRPVSQYDCSDWVGRLEGEPAFIIGNAPSLNEMDLEPLNNYFTIGINRAFYKIDPTVLFWQDITLWTSEHENVVKLQALKLCRDVSDPKGLFYHFYLKSPGYKFDPSKVHVLHGRGSSGPLACQIACALGCNPLILIGMDCKTEGKKTDFYGKNKYWLPHTQSNCQKGLAAIKKKCPAEVIFCGNNELWPKAELPSVLASLKDHEHSRQWFVHKLLGIKSKQKESPNE